MSGDRELDYDEFRMFTFAAIDAQAEIQRKNEEKRELKLKKKKSKVNTKIAHS